METSLRQEACNYYDECQSNLGLQGDIYAYKKEAIATKQQSSLRQAQQLLFLNASIRLLRDRFQTMSQHRI